MALDGDLFISLTDLSLPAHCRRVSLEILDEVAIRLVGGVLGESGSDPKDSGVSLFDFARPRGPFS